MSIHCSLCLQSLAAPADCGGLFAISQQRGEKTQSLEQFQLLITAKEIVTFSGNQRLRDLGIL